MQPFRNLVPDSAPIQDTIQLLRTSGGRAPALHVAESVMQLTGLDADDAILHVAELIKDDWRLRLDDGTGEVEFACEDEESRTLEEADYVVFDLETTGPKTPPARILELGACRVRAGQIVGEFQTLLNPGMTIPPFISRLTGISDAMVRNAPAFEEVADEWLRFADRAVLVAHDAHFDVRFINHEVSLVYPGRRMFNAYLCTVSLSRRLFPELGFYRLHALAEYFAVALPNHHRAAADARATAEIFLRLLPLLAGHGVRDISAARSFKLKARKSDRAASAS